MSRPLPEWSIGLELSEDPIDRFVFDNEPAARDEAAVWRAQVQAVIELTEERVVDAVVAIWLKNSELKATPPEVAKKWLLERVRGLNRG